jgi:hypothetical protein
MLEMEKYMESFTEAISKRFEKQEENFKNLTDKVKSFDVSTQREYKNRLRRLEDRKNDDENDDIELQQVKSLYFSLFFDLHQFLNHFIY